jgi:hypothetical protein
MNGNKQKVITLLSFLFVFKFLLFGISYAGVQPCPVEASDSLQYEYYGTGSVSVSGQPSYGEVQIIPKECLSGEFFGESLRVDSEIELKIFYDPLEYYQFDSFTVTHQIGDDTHSFNYTVNPLAFCETPTSELVTIHGEPIERYNETRPCGTSCDSSLHKAVFSCLGDIGEGAWNRTDWEDFPYNSCADALCGQLQVIITPEDIGGRWNVTGPKNHSNQAGGAVVSELPEGDYTLNFHHVNNWLRPNEVEFVVELPGGELARNGENIPGNLQFYSFAYKTISMSEDHIETVINSGPSDPILVTADDDIDNVTATSPGKGSVEIINGGGNLFQVSYTPGENLFGADSFRVVAHFGSNTVQRDVTVNIDAAMGTLKVELATDDVGSTSGYYSRLGSVNIPSGGEVDIPVPSSWIGDRTVTFNPIPGYFTPQSMTINTSENSFEQGETLHLVATYQKSSSVKVEFINYQGPERWRVVGQGSSWKKHNETQHLAGGTHQIEFLSIEDWLAPGIVEVIVDPGASKVVSAEYTPLNFNFEITREKEIDRQYFFQRFTVQQSGQSCPITVNPALAAINAQSGLSCLMVFDEILEGFVVQGNRIEGRYVNAGSQNLDLRILLVQKNGDQLDIFHDSMAVDVLEHGLEFELVASEEGYTLGESLANVSLVSVGEPCALVSNEQSAINSFKGTSHLRCWYQFTSIPDGLVLNEDLHRVRGVLENHESLLTSAKIYVVMDEQNQDEVADLDLELVLTTPESPQIDLVKANHRNCDSELFTAPTEGGRSLSVIVTGYSHVNILLYEEDDLVEERTFYRNSNRNLNVGINVDVEPKPLWNITNYRVEVEYLHYPEIVEVREFEVVTVPSFNLRSTLTVKNEPDSRSFNIGHDEELALQLKLDNPREEFGYDPSLHGEWETRVFVPIGRERELVNEDPILINAHNDTLDINVDHLAGERAFFIAEASLVSPIEGYERTLESNRIRVEVVNTEAPRGDVEARSLGGPAPINLTFTLRPEREFLRLLESINWEMSVNEDEWEVFCDKNRTRASHIFEEGRYFIRAAMTNSFSGNIGYSEVLEVNAYTIPELIVTGPEAMLVGSERTLTASVELEGHEVPGAIVEWWNEETLLGTGKELTINPESPAAMRLDIKARHPEAPEEERAWAYLRKVMYIYNPSPITGSINGPSSMETGLEYVFYAALRMPGRGIEQDAYPIEGEWRLPGGETIDAVFDDDLLTILTYTPPDDIDESNFTEIALNVWLVDFQEDTAGELTRRIRVEKYIWPEFALDIRQNIEQAPSDVRITVIPLNYRGRLTDTEFDWDMPGSFEESRLTGQRLLGTFTAPGVYPFEVTISDDRGSTTTVFDQVTVQEVMPREIHHEFRFSNQWEREPLSMRIRAWSTGGHVYDRDSEYRYWLNDVSLDDTCRSRTCTLRDLPDGEYDLRIEITSRHGNVNDKTVTFVVNENQPPQCEPIVPILHETARYTSIRINPVCHDPDGRIRGIEWHAGEEVISYSSRFRTRDDQLHTIPGDVITLVVQDCSEAETRIDVPISGLMP